MRETPERKANPNHHQTSSRERDAVRRKSGESVDHSDPGLMEPSIPPTADRKSAARVSVGQGANLRPASHQPKNGRGLGQSPISAEGAVPPSLDSIQNNRDTPRDPYRKKYCGKFTLLRISAQKGGVGRFFKATCKCWDCPNCAPRKANEYRKAIGKAAEEHRLNTMLTLTLDPSKLSGGQDSAHYISEVFQTSEST